MPKRTRGIPLNKMSEAIGPGCFVGRAAKRDLELYDVVKQSHRDDFHLFFFQEEGVLEMEVDFRQYKLKSGNVFYIQPRQVHRILGHSYGTLSVCAMSDETLQADVGRTLQRIAPARPLRVKKEAFAVMLETIALCMKMSVLENEMQPLLMRNSCSLLSSLVAAEYNAGSSSGAAPRGETISQAFRVLLEQEFINMRRPAQYARALNLSVAYLNECVRLYTGQSVSACIRERLMLEARRLLYHSDQSIKEIADELGFDDHAYFSRVFADQTGMSATLFRNKNRDLSKTNPGGLF